MSIAVCACLTQFPNTSLLPAVNLDAHSECQQVVTPAGATSGGIVSAVRKAGAAVGKAGVAVGQTFGLQAKPKPKGVGHYIMLILAPVGALAVFGALAIFLSHRMGAWPPSGTSGFTPLPTRDDYLVASPASGATLDTSRLKSKEDDTAEVRLQSCVAFWILLLQLYRSYAYATDCDSSEIAGLTQHKPLVGTEQLQVSFKST